MPAESKGSMRETPEKYRARTGNAAPVTDVSIAAGELGTTPRPPREDEVVPTLFRDVGPQALGLFLEGALVDLQGPDSVCVYMRDATLPGFMECVAEFGALTILQPVSMGPWVSGQAGIWIAEKGRWPVKGSIAFSPAEATADLTALDAKLVDLPDAAALREALGGAAYDVAVDDSTRRLRQYLEDWEAVERNTIPLRAVLKGPSQAKRDELQRILSGEGLSEKDLLANWFHLTRARRDDIRVKIAAVSARIAPRP